MAAGDEQQKIGKRLVLGEPDGERMTLEMVNGLERLVVGEGERLGGHDSHQHAADQAGSAGRRDSVQIGKTEPRLGQRLAHQSVEPLEMGTGGDFGNDPAEPAMLGELAVDDIGQDRAARSARTGPTCRRRLDNGDRRFVAARFDAQYAHACLLASGGHLS